MFGLLDNYFSRSPKWRTVRQNHLEKQPFCQACGSKKNLEVHHIEPVHLNPDRELDSNNLITLCSNNCHILFGHLMDYKSWNENVVEDCTEYFSKIKKRPYHETFYTYNGSSSYSIFFKFISWWNKRP